MAGKRHLSDRALFRLGVDNRRSEKRARKFGMPAAAEHWQGEYDAVVDEFRERDAKRDKKRRG